MNQAPISPDDPRLTAYALGELPEAERAELDAAVQVDPALRAAVAEIRDLAADLTDALATEPVALPSPVSVADRRDEGLRRVTRFPYLLVSGLAAAGFAVVVVLHEPSPSPAPAVERTTGPERRIYELNLAPLPEVAATVPETAVDAAVSDLRTGGAAVSSGGAATFAATASAVPTAPASALAVRAPSFLRRQADGFVSATAEPLSAVPIEADATAFAEVRRFLRDRELPPREAVRVAGLINSFPYRFPPPSVGATEAIATGIEAASAPWNPSHRLVRIGLKGREVAPGIRPPANLVFLIDVSGSMHAPARLPVVLETLRQLVDRLRPDDRIAVVTYGGRAGLVLPPTSATEKRAIHAALAGLHPVDSGTGLTGIQLAYDVAAANVLPGGLNRVLLCTDGDFDLGVADGGELVRMVGERAQSGIVFDVLGFDADRPDGGAFAQLAQAGRGFHGHASTTAGAHRLLVGQVEGAFAAVVRDVKVEVEFNPARVESYRLIGYEDRAAGATAGGSSEAVDLDAGRTVTALYEVVPRGPAAAAPSGAPDAQRYALPPLPLPQVDPSVLHELLTVRVHYRQPDSAEGTETAVPFVDGGTVFADASGDFKFAAAVAGFGLILRDSPHKGAATFDQVLSWAEAGLKDDAEGHRAEFVELVKQARDLSGG